MKKVLALTFFLGALTTVFGQKGYSNDGRGGSRDVAVQKNNRNGYPNDDFRNDSHLFTSRERDAQIERINREFDYKVIAVKKDRYLRNPEKKRAFKRLESERIEQIRQVNWRFANQKSSYYNDHDERGYRRGGK